MLKYFMTHKIDVNEKKNALLNGKTELFFTSLRICSTKGELDTYFSSTFISLGALSKKENFLCEYDYTNFQDQYIRSVRSSHLLPALPKLVNFCLDLPETN